MKPLQEVLKTRVGLRPFVSAPTATRKLANSPFSCLPKTTLLQVPIPPSLPLLNPRLCPYKHPSSRLLLPPILPPPPLNSCPKSLPTSLCPSFLPSLSKLTLYWTERRKIGPLRITTNFVTSFLSSSTLSRSFERCSTLSNASHPSLSKGDKKERPPTGTKSQFPKFPKFPYSWALCLSFFNPADKESSFFFFLLLFFFTHPFPFFSLFPMTLSPPPWTTSHSSTLTSWPLLQL